MAIHKVEVEWHDLAEDPSDVPVTDDQVYVIVQYHDGSRRVDEWDYRYANGEWEIAVQPSEDDPYPDGYEPASFYPGSKIIAWCKPLLPSY